MKKLIALFIIISSYASAQTDSTQLARRIYSLEKGVNHMAVNLDNAHYRFKQGTVCMVAGLAIAGAGAGLINEKSGPYLMGAGGLIMIAGTILQIDANKFMARAGMVTLTPTGITIDLNK
jgi:hypothetical protein